MIWLISGLFPCALRLRVSGVLDLIRSVTSCQRTYLSLLVLEGAGRDADVGGLLLGARLCAGSTRRRFPYVAVKCGNDDIDFDLRLEISGLPNSIRLHFRLYRLNDLRRGAVKAFEALNPAGWLALDWSLRRRRAGPLGRWLSVLEGAQGGRLGHLLVLEKASVRSQFNFRG